MHHPSGDTGGLDLGQGLLMSITVMDHHRLVQLPRHLQKTVKHGPLQIPWCPVAVEIQTYFADGHTLGSCRGQSTDLVKGGLIGLLNIMGVYPDSAENLLIATGNLHCLAT